MKKFIAIIFICLPFFAMAQTEPPTQVFNGRLYEYKNALKAKIFLPAATDTIGIMPSLLAPGAIIYRLADKSLYLFVDPYWQKLATGSGGILVRDSLKQLSALPGKTDAVTVVKDSMNGGVFYWSAIGTPDSTTVFPAANGYWVRSRDLLNKTGYYRAPWPVEFTWRPFSIYRDAVGKWTTSFDMQEFINQQIPGKAVQYVNYATGNDANAGLSPAQAKKSVNAAYSAGGRVIYLSSGIIDWNGFKTLTTDGSDLVLIGAGMDKTYITSNDTANNVFTLSSGTTYTTSRPNIGGAFDYKYTNEDGYFIRHKNVNSLALCQSTPGSIYVTGSTVYVNLIDGRAPDANFKLQFDAQAALIQADAGKIIMKDLTFAGHRQGTYIRGTTESTPSTAQVYAYNCSFIYGLLESGLRVNNIAYCHTENCVGYGNGIDGFNYKSTANINKMKIVEVNNKGYRNGLLNGINLNSVKNGSSAHDSLTVVRVGGTFYENAGPNVVDVGATTLSYNVGVNANNSKGYVSVDPNGGNNDFLVSSPSLSTSKMYLLDCTSFGSTVAIEGRGGSQMYSIKSLYPAGAQHVGNVVFLDSLPASSGGNNSITSEKYNAQGVQKSILQDSLNNRYTKSISDSLFKQSTIFVEQFRKPGMTDWQVIDSATKAMQSNGAIELQAGRTYMIDNSVLMPNGGTLIGNAATIKRANQTATTLSVAAGSAATSITVVIVPVDWKVGSILQLYTDSTTNKSILGSRIIMGISGNVITLSAPVGTSGDATITTWPIGTSVRRVYPLITSRNYSFNTSQSFNVYNLKIDGNKENNAGSFYWNVNQAIVTNGVGSRIVGCDFYNISNECIYGHGFYVAGNTGKRLFGSFVHLSGNDTVKWVKPAIIISNTIDSVNLAGVPTMTHSEAAITLSYSGGYATIANNRFSNGAESCIGSISWTDDIADGGTSNFEIIGNYFHNFKSIVYYIYDAGIRSPSKNIYITNNTFDSCGVNDWTPYYSLNAYKGFKIGDNNLVRGTTWNTMKSWNINQSMVIGNDSLFNVTRPFSSFQNTALEIFDKKKEGYPRLLITSDTSSLTQGGAAISFQTNKTVSTEKRFAEIVGGQDIANINTNVSGYMSLSTTLSGNLIERMRITSAGDLGIGISTPFNASGYRTATIDGITGSIYNLNVNGTRTGSLIADGSGLNVFTAGSSIPILFSINGSEKMRVNSTGKIGINNTSPASYMSVSGSIAAAITSTAVNLTLTDAHYTVRATASGITLTLPTAANAFSGGAGRIYCIQNYNTGGNITITSFLNNGTPTTTIASGSKVWIQSDGANWYQIN